VLLTVENVARATSANDRRPEDTNRAETDPQPRASGHRQGGARPERAVVALLPGLVVCGLGWMYRAPIMARFGPTASEASRHVAEDPAETASDPNVVSLDLAGQARIGLAFGEASIRPIILPMRAPGTVAFDERRVTRLGPRT
jgi:cobalt-zinc-cadmium efflux system membrane fusion protein